MKYFGLIVKNVAAIFQLQWKIEKIPDMFLQYSVLCGLLRLPGKLSQVTFPYKVVINNHSITIEWNPKFFNYSQGFNQNFGTSQPS